MRLTSGAKIYLALMRDVLANGSEGITIAGQPGYRVKFQQPRLIDPLPEKGHGPRNKP